MSVRSVSGVLLALCLLLLSTGSWVRGQGCQASSTHFCIQVNSTVQPERYEINIGSGYNVALPLTLTAGKTYTFEATESMTQPLIFSTSPIDGAAAVNVSLLNITGTYPLQASTSFTWTPAFPSLVKSYQAQGLADYGAAITVNADVPAPPPSSTIHVITFDSAKSAYAINGTTKGVMKVKAGEWNELRLTNIPAGHPLVISASGSGVGIMVSGGQYGAMEGQAPYTGTETLRWKPVANQTPQTMFYSCGNHANMGGKIEVEGGKLPQVSAAGAVITSPVVITLTAIVLSLLFLFR